ncbi:hypothetical protein [Streptomyces sp. VRA16 Mangrove soil]|uniref:LppU/SCO3897 family protein n=1 Tax=Streptomyces sp. VRA16 Mangrove soil TaxID=2817434 RepID=UPI001A9DD193|nr:hypothetical protein [Streptomyces sp. VRA16 Mangrove soil]MBO1337793.1 hypothetical protein [Streptomyces sp. VRA16 Mangrove soil]
MPENSIAPTRRRVRPTVLAAAALTVLALPVLTGCGESENDAASGFSPSYAPTYSPTYSYAPSDQPSDLYSPTDDDASSYDDPSYGESADTEPSEDPSPYTSGTCLNGTLPDSTTAQAVNDVDEVDCSAADAHYKVIQTFPMTSDMSQCNANSQTQYAFSSRYTMNGAVVSEYVYCLVGLGSYAR